MCSGACGVSRRTPAALSATSAIPRILLEVSGIRVVASGFLLAATGFPLPMLRIVMNPWHAPRNHNLCYAFQPYESATTNCNRIGNNGAKYLADSLRNNTTLTTLDLTGNKIGRNGAQYLAGILRNNKTLLTLDMDSNYIQDHGAEQMASGLKHNKVTNFVLPSHIGLP
ncbi:unnamed protein product [Rotaria socialis]